MSRLARCLLLISVLAVPAGARASVSVTVVDGRTIYVSDVADTANTLTITRAGGTVTVRDTSSPPTIGSGTSECMSSGDDPNTLVCTVADPILESVYAGGGDDSVTLAGIAGKNVLGADGADTLTGGELGDLLDGDAGNDTITGGGGADQLIGRGGDDRLEARDGVADVGVDCGDGAADVAVTDASDPHAAGCEADDRAAAGGGGDGGGTTTGPSPDAGPAPVFVETKERVKVPNAKPRKQRGKWRFVSLRALQRALDKLGVPYRVRSRPVALATVKPEYRKAVDDGDVVAQAPAPEPGSLVTIDTACASVEQPGCRLNLRVNVYDEALELSTKKCPYKDKRLTRQLRDETYVKALDILADHDCAFRIVNYVESTTDTEERIQDATISKAENRFFVNLVVRRPLRSDFTVSLAPRPFSDYGDAPDLVAGFERELDLGADGKLTSSDGNKGVLHVIINENFSARFVEHVRIELVKNPAGKPGQAKAIGSSETGDAGAVTFTFPVDWTGDLEISVRVKSKRTKDDLVEDTMRGWISVPVVKRDTGKLLATQSGRAFRFKDGAWRRVDLFTEAMGAFAGALRDLNDAFGATACRAQEGDANPQRLVNTCWRAGLAVTATSNGGTSVGTGRAGTQTLPGYVVRNGALAEASVPAAIVPDDRAVLGVAAEGSAAQALLGAGRSPLTLAPGTIVRGGTGTLVSDGGSGLIGKVGGVPLIGADGGSLIGADGGTLIGADGASAIPDSGVGLLPVSLIGPDGGT